MNEIVMGIQKCLQNIGVQFDIEEGVSLPLDTYIEDSVSFISFIVELEQFFNIEVIDKYFDNGILTTIEDIINMVEELQSFHLGHEIS